MKIKNIHIRNYKGFENSEINFHPKVNVFIGSNASGKTTLLNAILKSIYSITKKANSISSNEINYRATHASIESEFYDCLNYNGQIAGILYSANAQKNSSLQAENKVFFNWLENELKSPTTIPIFKYYSADRKLSMRYGESDLSTIRQGINQIPQLAAWSIIEGSISYTKFHKWFLENETNELLMQRDARDFDKQAPALADVRKALDKAFKLIGYKDVSLKTTQIKRAGDSKFIPILILENNSTKEQELLDNKSDGEKTIITLIADIAYTMSIAKKFSSNDEDFLNSSGIVIIDEIEKHLHPNWQRRIIPMLTEIFPSIQFFIATHSPQIISSVKSESVFLLANFKVYETHLKTLGEDSNSLLKTIFDSTDRPDQFIELIEKFDDLMDNDVEEKELQQVIDQIKLLYNQDESTGISNLIDELNIKLSAYLFDKDYEKNN